MSEGLGEELTETQKKILRDLEENGIKVESVYNITDRYNISYAGAYKLVEALVKANVVREKEEYAVVGNKVYFRNKEIGRYQKIVGSEYYCGKFLAIVESDNKYKLAVYEDGKLIGETKEHNFIRPNTYKVDGKIYHLDDILEELVKQ